MSSTITKRFLFDELYDSGGLFIRVAPSKTVILPSKFMDMESVILNLSPGLPIPIRNIHSSEEGLSVTLSFDRSPFDCYFPWDSVVQMWQYPEPGSIAITWVSPEDISGPMEERSSEKPRLRLVKNE